MPRIVATAFLILLNVVALLAPATAADRTSVRTGEPLMRFDKLKAGTSYYLRYRIKSGGELEPIDLQSKEIRFESLDGVRRVRILQSWRGAAGLLRLDSTFDVDTLRPITHQRDLHKDGTIRREGFRFLAGRVVGIADQPDNVRKDFEIAAPVPTFNFEVDLETLKTLPLRRNAEFEIVFYHPGGDPPAPYLFKVAGEESLSLAGRSIECWVITTDYNRPSHPVSRFWVEKDSQTVIRVHHPLPDGSAIVKALLPAAPH